MVDAIAFLRTATATIASVALLGAGVPLAAQTAKPMTAAQANAQSAADAAARQAEAARQAAIATETPDQKKVRLKAEKEAAKQADKARRDAERAARPKSNAGNKIAGCVGGAAVGVALSLIFGGKSAGAIAGSAIAGCAAGWALGAALKGQDSKKLTNYVESDYSERDDLASDSWTAPESGQAITLQTLDTSYKPVNHTVGVAAGIAFDPANIQVAIVKMRVTAPASLRSSPSLYDGDNVIGDYGANEIVHAYGTTLDGQWTYLSETQEDMSDLVIGYVPTSKLSIQLNKPRTAPLVIAKVKPKKATSRLAAKGGRGRAGVKKAAPAPVEVATSSPQMRQVAFAAPTRCKNVQATALGNTARQSACSGARNIA